MSSLPLFSVVRVKESPSPFRASWREKSSCPTIVFLKLSLLEVGRAEPIFPSTQAESPPPPSSCQFYFPRYVGRVTLLRLFPKGATFFSVCSRARRDALSFPLFFSDPNRRESFVLDLDLFYRLVRVDDLVCFSFFASRGFLLVRFLSPLFW